MAIFYDFGSNNPFTLGLKGPRIQTDQQNQIICYNHNENLDFINALIFRPALFSGISTSPKACKFLQDTFFENYELQKLKLKNDNYAYQKQHQLAYCARRHIFED